jgi:uncharacterized membrane protein
MKASTIRTRSTLAGLVAVLTLGALATTSVAPSMAATKKTTKAKAKAKAKPKVTLAIPADFDVRFVQDAQAVTAGETAVYTLDVLPSKTFQGAVVFDFANLTDRFTGRVVAQTATRLRLDITVPPFANTNSGVFILRGRSGNITKEALFRLNVTARPQAPTTTAAPSSSGTTVAPQFTLSAAETTKTVAPGTAAQYAITVNRTGGSSGNVDLRVDGLPTGVTAAFAPASTDGASTLTVTPSATTPSGSYLLSVVGQAGSTTRAVAVQIVIRRVADFTLALAPTSVTIPAGNDAVAAVNVVPIPGSTSPFAPDVTFTATGLPADAAALFDPNPSNGLTTMRVRTSAAAATGSYKVTVTGTSGTFSHSVVLTVVVEKGNVGGFGISATPNSASVAPGATATYTVAITPSGGFNSTITFAVKNLPPFTTATVTQQSASQATIAVATSSTTPAGTFPLQITGTSGSLSATVQVGLVVA